MWSGRKTLFSNGFSAASELTVPDVLSILPYSSHDCLAASPYAQIEWYDWWVHNQIQKEPKELFSTLPDYDPASDERRTHSFIILWQEISRYITANESVSIDDIILHLVETRTLQPSTDSEALALTSKHLVFAVIGWQTMLYRPNMQSCPPIQLAIANEMDGHQGQAHMCLKQNNSACRRHMHNFLLGFGMLLPPRNFSVQQSPEAKTAFNDLKIASAASFNAHLLASIGEIRIKWIDSLACHLEFDTSSNTLFLFRYPSFCVANLPSGKSVLAHKSVIHACAAPHAGTMQWATADEVTQMLHETVLSYRLLFGQNKAARKFFRKLGPFDSIPERGRDEFLVTLCGQKHCRTWEVPERETYDLPRDFPILRERLALLLRHLSNKEPRTWKELWLDKRDSASWLTFWALLIFGGLGIILAFIQVVLQIVQITQN